MYPIPVRAALSGVYGKIGLSEFITPSSSCVITFRTGNWTDMPNDCITSETLQNWTFELVSNGPARSPRSSNFIVRAESEDRLTVDGRRHRHEDFYALYIVRRGKGVHVIDGVSYGISRGDAYLMRPGMEHQYRSYRELKIAAVYFTSNALTERLRPALEELGGLRLLHVDSVSSSGQARLLHLSPSHYDVFYRCFLEMRREWEDQTASAAILAEDLFARILIHLLRLRGWADSEPEDVDIDRSAGIAQASAHERVIAAAVRFIDSHYGGEVNVEAMAERAGFSARGFTRVFTSVMGRSPRNYLSYVRLERAKALLVETSTPVTEVGDLAGFGEPAYFTRVFKAHTGQTPTEYRRLHRA